jgi:hypothetical protein
MKDPSQKDTLIFYVLMDWLLNLFAGGMPPGHRRTTPHQSQSKVNQKQVILTTLELIGNRDHRGLLRILRSLYHTTSLSSCKTVQ